MEQPSVFRSRDLVNMYGPSIESWINMHRLMQSHLIEDLGVDAAIVVYIDVLCELVQGIDHEKSIVIDSLVASIRDSLLATFHLK